MQGDDPRYLTASATCKHIDAYAGPDNLPVTRYVFDAKVSWPFLSWEIKK